VNSGKRHPEKHHLRLSLPSSPRTLTKSTHKQRRVHALAATPTSYWLAWFWEISFSGRKSRSDFLGGQATRTHNSSFGLSVGNRESPQAAPVEKAYSGMPVAIVHNDPREKTRDCLNLDKARSESLSLLQFFQASWTLVLVHPPPPSWGTQCFQDHQATAMASGARRISKRKRANLFFFFFAMLGS
jgi:hypothetical protein